MHQSITLLFTFMLLATCLHSQEHESQTFNGETYYKINGNWHLLNNSDQDFIPLNSNNISLKFNDDVNPSQVEGFESQYNLTFVRKATTGWYDYVLNSTSDLLEQCTWIQNSSLVQLVEVTAPIRFDLIPNDSAAYHPPTQTWYQWGIPRTEVDQVWNKTTGDPSIVAAIIDSGVDWWHEDFAQATGTTGTFWLNPGEVPGDGIDNDTNGFVDDVRGWNFRDNNNDISDSYPMIHGTGVAGVLGARTNNHIGVAGVAGGWGSSDGLKVMGIKLHNAYADSTAAISNNLDDAILYAAENGAHIMNMSISAFSNYASIEAAIETAYNQYNSVLVSGSGNDTGTVKPVRFPANHELVIGVANSWQNDRTHQTHTGPNLDLGAPGNSYAILDTSDGYVMQSGSSLSSPFVAGIAGLMLSINPCLNNEEVRNILIRRADRVNGHHPINNPGGYEYNLDPFKPGHSNDIGYGRVNAKKAVDAAEDMHETSLDLYIKDHYSDFGYPNSYPSTARFDDWSDVWVRNNPDGHDNQEMEEIEYSTTSDAYVYVKVRNKSCVASDNTDSLKVYWTKSSTGSSWPQNWDGSDQNVGNIIGSIPIPSLQPGEDTVLEFDWTIDPEPVQSWGTCILARIESSADPITPYPNDLMSEVRENNNIAVRNLYVMNIFPGKPPPVVDGVEMPYGLQVYSGNVNEGNTEPVDIHFDVPEGYTGPSIISDSEVRLFLSDELWSVFEMVDFSEHEGIEVVDHHELLVTEEHAVIRNLEFSPEQRESFFFGFNFLTDEIDTVYHYRYHITQHQGEHITGSMNFNITRAERDHFDADAGYDEQIYEGETVQLSAEDINEPATYNWYDSNDSLVYSGKNPSLSPSVTEKYKLEVIADADLHKDYDEITVTVNPYAIKSVSPNPATSTLKVEYDADEASSAYIMIYPTSGSSGYNYILDTQLNETTVDVSSYMTGAYTVILVCDGQIVDSEILSIQ